MKAQFALAALLAASASLAACGWLLPDGVLEGNPGDPVWGEPVLLRSAGGTIVLRPSLTPDAGDFYYSEGTQLFYADGLDAAGQPLLFRDDAGDGGPLLGDSPTPTFVSVFSGIGFMNDDALFFSVSIDDSKTLYSAPTFVDCGGIARAPYTPAAGVAYFTNDAKLFRFSPSIEGSVPIEVSIERRVGTPPLNTLHAPVATNDESTLYFADGDLISRHLWMATHGNEAGPKYIDAHPLFPESTNVEFPTAVSADGKELIFTRVVEGGTAAYKMKQVDP